MSVFILFFSIKNDQSYYNPFPSFDLLSIIDKNNLKYLLDSKSSLMVFFYDFTIYFKILYSFLIGDKSFCLPS
jgi:hypothetical protein